MEGQRVVILIQKKKVKDSPNRPGVFQGVPGGLGSQIYMKVDT